MEYPRCDICDTVYKNWKSLKTHRTTVHSNVKFSTVHKCNICRRDFETMAKYKGHLKGHRSYMRCNLCCFVTTRARRAELKTHMEDHDAGKLFCSRCNVFYDSEQAPKHAHSDSKPEHKIEVSETHAADTTINRPQDPAPDKGGGLEVNLPFDALDACRELEFGQTMKMTGTSSGLTKAGFFNKQDVSLLAQRKDNSICLLLQASKMGSILQSKLSRRWQCELTSYQLYEPSQGSTLAESDDLDDEKTNGACILRDSGCEVKENDCISGETPMVDIKDNSVQDDVNTSSLVDQLDCLPCKPEDHHVQMPDEKGDSLLLTDSDGVRREDLGICGIAVDMAGDGEPMLIAKDDASSCGDEGDDDEADELYILPSQKMDTTANSYQNETKSHVPKKHGRNPGKRKATMGIAAPTVSKKMTRGRMRQSLSETSGEMSADLNQERIVRKERKARRSGIMQMLKSGRVKDQDVKTEVQDPEDDVAEDLPDKNCSSVWTSNRGLKEEVLKLNVKVVSEMVETGSEEMRGLPSQDLAKQFVCIMCMKLLRKKRWYFFCNHLDEIHFMTPLAYKELLSMESATERQEKMKTYHEQQVLMKKRYKEVKYKVKEEDMMQCPACSTVLTAFPAFCAHVMSVHINDEKRSELVQYIEELKEQRKSLSKRQKKMPDIEVKCDYCGEQKVGLNGIKVHIRMAHPREPDVAEKLARYREYVKDETLRVRRLLYHAERKDEPKNQFCRFCGDKFSFRSSRGRHEKFSCEKNPNRIITFTCQYCDHRFVSKEELNEHRRRHQEEDFKYVCDICGMVRRTKAGMYDHKKSKHDTKPPKHKCPYCEKAYHTKDRMQTHLTVHSDLRAFQCEICGSSFKTRASVVKHQNAVHYNKYTYYCDKCGHGMSKLSYLQAHKCGRIRRTQDGLAQPRSTHAKDEQEQQIHNVSMPATWLPETVIAADTELTTLPKVEVQELVYHEDDQLDKQHSLIETEIATHILMGSNLQASSSTEMPATSMPAISLPIVSMPTVSLPYAIDQNSHIIEVIQGHPVATEYNTEYVSPQEVLIDYTQASHILNSKPVEIQYTNVLNE